MFTGFDLTLRDSYSTILVEVLKNHIFAEKTYFTNHMKRTEQKIMVLKAANKNQIIQQCQNQKKIIDDFRRYRVKVL